MKNNIPTKPGFVSKLTKKQLAQVGREAEKV